MKMEETVIYSLFFVFCFFLYIHVLVANPKCSKEYFEKSDLEILLYSKENEMIVIDLGSSRLISWGWGED